ncbi:MAG: hypothetical protein ABH827_01330 [bacterium]
MRRDGEEWFCGASSSCTPGLCVLGFIFMLPALKADLTAQVGSLTKSLTVLKGKYVLLAEMLGQVRGKLGAGGLDKLRLFTEKESEKAAAIIKDFKERLNGGRPGVLHPEDIGALDEGVSLEHVVLNVFEEIGDKIERLDLSGYKIKKIDVTTLKKLKSLCLGNCGLEEIKGLDTLENLVEVNLRYNKLKQIPWPAGLKKSESFYLGIDLRYNPDFDKKTVPIHFDESVYSGIYIPTKFHKKLMRIVMNFFGFGK